MKLRRAGRTALPLLASLALLGSQIPSAGAQEPDLQEGDLLVGASIQSGPSGGRVWRVRDGQKAVFCETTTNGFDSGYSGAPQELMLDSQGRVVFLAPLSSNWGLFRCSSMGAIPERLAFLRTLCVTASPPEGWPDPFPSECFAPHGIAGLHLVRQRAAVIDDDVSGGAPRVGSQDQYVVALAAVNPANGQGVATFVRRYLPDSGEWQEVEALAFNGNATDMVNEGGVSYIAHELNRIIRKEDGLSLHAEGSVFGIQFGLDVQLFGVRKEVARLILDDSQIENVDSGCDPNTHPEPPSLSRPFNGGYAAMDGFDNIVVQDGKPVLSSASVATGTPYLTAVSTTLLNRDPNDDVFDYFWRPETGCQAEPSLKFTSILPFFMPGTGASTKVNQRSLASTSTGLVGTERDRVVRVVPGVGLVEIASGFIGPWPVAEYPTSVTPNSGATIIIRLDSPVNIQLTDPNGMRIGVDPLAGTPVNDFGEYGFDSGPGEPRFYAINNPVAGDYDVDTVGTGDGDFAINVYFVDLEQPVGQRIRATGAATSGSTSTQDFRLDADGTITFIEQDADGDGYSPPEDCDDNDPDVNPGHGEVPYNGKDDDCRPATPDDDLDGDTYPLATDCDDNDFLVNPGQAEVPYNGKDDDCNPATLDDDLDRDNYPRATDCDDNNPAVHPGAPEVANGIDDDCDGQIDEGLGQVCNGLTPTITGQGVIQGTPGDDVILGSAGNDQIFGGDGNDTVCGLGGRDVIQGGPGNDWLSGGDGFDLIRGEDGSDHMLGGGGPDFDICIGGNPNRSPGDSTDGTCEIVLGVP